jgi:hypothetical protein
MKKLYLAFALLFWNCSPIQAQVKAWLTNRFIVKTDLMQWAVNGARNIELETKINRKLSLSIGYLDASRRYKQTYNNSDFNIPNFFSYNSITINEKGIINSRLFTSQLRYFLSTVHGSPLSPYSFFLLGIGSADFLGTVPIYFFDPNFNIDHQEVEYIVQAGPRRLYSVYGVPVLKLCAGLGSQTIVFQNLTADISFGIEYNNFFESDQVDRKIVASMFRHYGPTIFQLGSSSNVGISLMVKIGYLIY